MRFAETTALLAHMIAQCDKAGIGGRVMLRLEAAYRDAIAGDLKLKSRNRRAGQAIREAQAALSLI